MKQHTLEWLAHGSCRIDIYICQQGATRREAQYMQSFERLLVGDFRGAADAFEEILAVYPKDLLAVRSAHDTYIILGDMTTLRDSASRVLGSWKGGPEEDLWAVNSMMAFALEEAGDYHRAWELAKAALALDPKGEEGDKMTNPNQLSDLFPSMWLASMGLEILSWCCNDLFLPRCHGSPCGCSRPRDAFRCVIIGGIIRRV